MPTGTFLLFVSRTAICPIERAFDRTRNTRYHLSPRTPRAKKSINGRSGASRTPEAISWASRFQFRSGLFRSVLLRSDPPPFDVGIFIQNFPNCQKEKKKNFEIEPPHRFRGVVQMVHPGHPRSGRCARTHARSRSGAVDGFRTSGHGQGHDEAQLATRSHFPERNGFDRRPFRTCATCSDPYNLFSFPRSLFRGPFGLDETSAETGSWAPKRISGIWRVCRFRPGWCPFRFRRCILSGTIFVLPFCMVD